MSDQDKASKGNTQGPEAASPEEPSLPRHDENHGKLLERSRIDIWEEDWSLIKDMVDDLKDQGVTDWYRYFEQHEDQSVRAYRLASVTSINQAALDIYHAPSRQVAIDITFGEIIPPEELVEFKANLVAFIEGRTSYEIETRELTFDDIEISTRRHVTLPPDHQMTWSRVLYTIEDTTESKRMEESLRESEARYREVFDDAPAALGVEDWSEIKKMIDELADAGVENWRNYFADHPDRVIEAYDLTELLQISNANLGLYGAASVEEYLGSNQGALVLPEELEAFVDVLIDLIEGRWVIDVTSWDDKMDGSKIMIRTRGVVPPAHRQNWSRLIYSLEDVTDQSRAVEALRNSEERLRTITDNLPAFVAYVDRDGRYQFANHFYEDWFNRSIDEIVGHPIEDVIGPDNFAAIAETHRKALRGETVTRSG